MTPFFLLAGLVVLAVAVLFTVWMRSRRRSVGAAHAVRLVKHWRAAIAVTDPARRVLETEKILDAALTVLGFSGSFGDKLKKAGPRFTNVQSIWDAHKLRNRIAHEAGFGISDAEAKRATDAFARGLRDVGVEVG